MAMAMAIAIPITMAIAIAMAMAILGSYCEEQVEIKNIGCTETSYPGFWEDLRHQGVTVEFA